MKKKLKMEDPSEDNSHQTKHLSETRHLWNQDQTTRMASHPQSSPKKREWSALLLHVFPLSTWNKFPSLTTKNMECRNIGLDMSPGFLRSQMSQCLMKHLILNIVSTIDRLGPKGRTRISRLYHTIGHTS